MSKLIKNKCEIESCTVTDPNLLELHHIIPRTDPNTTNNINNLAILCCLHHAMIDCNRLKIIGIYPSTQPPNGRTLIYELDGKRNIEGIDDSILIVSQNHLRFFRRK
jgi:hypothetical protein